MHLLRSIFRASDEVIAMCIEESPTLRAIWDSYSAPSASLRVTPQSNHVRPEHAKGVKMLSQYLQADMDESKAGSVPETLQATPKKLSDSTRGRLSIKPNQEIKEAHKALSQKPSPEGTPEQLQNTKRELQTRPSLMSQKTQASELQHEQHASEHSTRPTGPLPFPLLSIHLNRDHSEKNKALSGFETPTSSDSFSFCGPSSKSTHLLQIPGNKVSKHWSQVFFHNGQKFEVSDGQSSQYSLVSNRNQEDSHVDGVVPRYSFFPPLITRTSNAESDQQLSHDVVQNTLQLERLQIRSSPADAPGSIQDSPSEELDASQKLHGTQTGQASRVLEKPQSRQVVNKSQGTGVLVKRSSHILLDSELNAVLGKRSRYSGILIQQRQGDGESQDTFPEKNAKQYDLAMIVKCRCVNFQSGFTYLPSYKNKRRSFRTCHRSSARVGFLDLPNELRQMIILEILREPFFETITTCLEDKHNFCLETLVVLERVSPLIRDDLYYVFF